VAGDEIARLSHRTAVGACSLAAQGRAQDMRTLLGLYIKESEELDVPVRDALVILLNSTIGLSVHVANANGDAAAYFEDLAAQMASRP
jgi:hypothetical protein